MCPLWRQARRGNILFIKCPYLHVAFPRQELMILRKWNHRCTLPSPHLITLKRNILSIFLLMVRTWYLHKTWYLYKTMPGYSLPSITSYVLQCYIRTRSKPIATSSSITYIFIQLPCTGREAAQIRHFFQRWTFTYSLLLWTSRNKLKFIV